MKAELPWNLASSTSGALPQNLQRKKLTGRVPRKAAHDESLYHGTHWKATICGTRGRCHLGIRRIYWDCHALSSGVHLVELTLMGPELGKAALWGPGEKLPKGSLAAVYGWTSLGEWSPERGAHQNQEEKPPSPAGSLQHPLLIE